MVIPPTEAHPGAGAMFVDNGFTAEFLASMDNLYAKLTVVMSEKVDTCAGALLDSFRAIYHHC